VKAVGNPEVILPAYGCPDLVSAALCAGVKPVLVDMAADRPWMDLDQLRGRLNSQTVAIVAANLFGLSERLDQLRPISERAGVLLIEDSAQAFPGGGESAIWEGDLVVLSFGRGKPVSLLGGGAVLYRDAALRQLLPETDEPAEPGLRQRVGFRLQAMLYNRLIAPRLYWLPHSLPFLHLGETRYQPLSAIEAMDPLRQALLATNVAAYRADDMAAQTALAGMLKGLDGAAGELIDLPRVCRVPAQRPLLRYPLLVEAAARERLYGELRRRGLGPSTMYPAPLPGIAGLETVLAGQGPFPAAEAFAARILTLPTHQRVSGDDIARMRAVLSSI
jgi:dTDP-4-amino-4,6-dideoxygalactose transaminase